MSRLGNVKEKISSLKLSPDKMIKLEITIMFLLAVISFVTSIIRESTNLLVLSILMFSFASIVHISKNEDILYLKDYLEWL